MTGEEVGIRDMRKIGSSCLRRAGGLFVFTPAFRVLLFIPLFLRLLLTYTLLPPTHRRKGATVPHKVIVISTDNSHFVAKLCWK
jgi:hypothetical protein